MGLDRVKFHLVDSPLTNTNVISFGISVDGSKKTFFESLYPDFRRAIFENVNKFLSEINWKDLYNNSKKSTRVL